MNDFEDMNDMLGKPGCESKAQRVQKAQRTQRAKNAQLEMIGLVIIVIIVITALLIFLVYKLSNPTKNIQRIYMNDEIATNLLLSMNRVNVEECPYVAGNHKIEAIPSMAIFHKGRQVFRFNGVVDKDSLIKVLKKYI